jgi:hypothetical protein
MKATLKTTLIAGLAVLTLSVPTAMSSVSAFAASTHVSHYSCFTRHGVPCPTGPVKGTNKQTCKPNGEGCHRQY